MATRRKQDDLHHKLTYPTRMPPTHLRLIYWAVFTLFVVASAIYVLQSVATKSSFMDDPVPASFFVPVR
jgi:hypothetical protein